MELLYQEVGGHTNNNKNKNFSFLYFAPFFFSFHLLVIRERLHRSVTRCHALFFLYIPAGEGEIRGIFVRNKKISFPVQHTNKQQNNKLFE